MTSWRNSAASTCPRDCRPSTGSAPYSAATCSCRIRPVRPAARHSSPIASEPDGPGHLFRPHLAYQACPPRVEPTGHRAPIGGGHSYRNAFLPSDTPRVQQSMPIDVRLQCLATPRAIQLNHHSSPGSRRCDRTRRRCRVARDCLPHPRRANQLSDDAESDSVRDIPFRSALSVGEHLCHGGLPAGGRRRPDDVSTAMTTLWSCPHPFFGVQPPRREKLPPEFVSDRIPQSCQLRMEFSRLHEIRVASGTEADHRRGIGCVLHGDYGDQMMPKQTPRRAEPVGFRSAHVIHRRCTLVVRPSRPFGNHSRPGALGCAPLFRPATRPGDGRTTRGDRQDEAGSRAWDLLSPIVTPSGGVRRAIRRLT